MSPGLAGKENARFQTSTDFKNGTTQLADAQAGMDVWFPLRLDQEGNGGVNFCDFAGGEFFDRTDVGRAGEYVHGFHRFSLPFLRSFLISERILFSTRFISPAVKPYSISA